MKVLVTGATGFVGSDLITKLLDSGYNVAALIRKEHLKSDSRIEIFLIDDLNGEVDLSHTLKDIEVVVHLAARVHVIEEENIDPLAEYRKINVESTLNLARQASSFGVKRFVFLSSVKVNGEMTEKNMSFKADDIPNPQDPYGVSKLEAEVGLVRLAKKTGMEVVIVRPPLVYGPGVKANFLSMIKTLDKGIPLPLGNVSNKRSLVFIDNLVDLVMRVIEHPNAAGQVFLVSDDHDVSTSTLLKETSAALGKKARLIYSPCFLLRAIFFLIGKRALSQRLLDSLRVDITKTKEMLGWRPPVSFQEGIRRTAKDFLESAHHP